MKKFGKCVLAMLAAAAMVLSLAACNGKNASSDGTAQAQEIPEGKLFAPGTELSIAFGSHASWPYNENWPIWKYFQEATGVTFKVQAIPSADLGTKLPLMMASPESLPDMIHAFAKAQVDDYALSGAYVNFAEHEADMPNYTAFLNSFDETARKELINQRTSGDGNVYFAPAYGTHRVTNMRTWLYRKDVFEKHGLQAPTTYDELYEVAKKLKELYPESYPICFRGGLGKLNDTTPAWKNDFTYMHYYDYDIGEWKMGAQDPIMKDIVEYYIKLAKEGLVPPDYITIETKGWEELMSTDRGFITNDYVVRIDFFNVPNRVNNPDYTLEVMAPPIPNVPTGSAKLSKSNLDFSGWAVCNTGKEENIKNAFKVIDWMYTDEAIELLSWGKEGETYTVDKNGKKKFILGEGEQAIQKYGVGSNGLYQVIDQEAFENSYTEENIAGCIKTLDYLEERSNPAAWLALNEEEETRASTIINDLTNYCEEELSKFLLSQQPMSNWDAFQQGLIEMGAPELLEIYSAAYDRAMGE